MIKIIYARSENLFRTIFVHHSHGSFVQRQQNVLRNCWFILTLFHDIRFHISRAIFDAIRMMFKKYTKKIIIIMKCKHERITSAYTLIVGNTDNTKKKIAWKIILCRNMKMKNFLIGTFKPANFVFNIHCQDGWMDEWMNWNIFTHLWERERKKSNLKWPFLRNFK